MSTTLSQIRAQVLDILRQSSSDSSFTTAQLNSFVNQALLLAAVMIEHPRDMATVQADPNADTYPLPSDNLLIRTVYFGDDSIANDMKPLIFATEETLRELYPAWLDRTTSSTGRPRFWIMQDKRTLFIYPRVDAANGATGKKISIDYVYTPAPLSNDTDIPDLPVPYQDLLKYYAAHLCYLSLTNIDMANQLYKEFGDHHKLIQSAATKESAEALGFSWGYDEDVNDDHIIGGIVIP